jgi:hypothetical protein
MTQHWVKAVRMGMALILIVGGTCAFTGCENPLKHLNINIFRE